MLNNESVISESNKKRLFEWQCNDIEETYDTVIKPAPGATACDCFIQNELNETKEWNLFQSKHLISMHLADVLREPPCQKC